MFRSINQPLLEGESQPVHNSRRLTIKNQLSMPDGVLGTTLLPYLDPISRHRMKRVAKRLNKVLSVREKSIDVMQADIHYWVDRDANLRNKLNTDGSKLDTLYEVFENDCCICAYCCSRGGPVPVLSQKNNCAAGTGIWGAIAGGLGGMIYACITECSQYSCAAFWAKLGIGLGLGSGGGLCLGVGSACICYQCVKGTDLKQYAALLDEKSKTTKQIVQTEKRLVVTLTRLEKEFKAKAASTPQSKTSSVAMISMLAVALTPAPSSLAVKSPTPARQLNVIEVEETAALASSTTFVENGVIYTGTAQQDDWKENDGDDFLRAVAGNNATLQRDLLYAAAVRRGAVKSNGVEMKATKSDVLAEPPPAVPTTLSLNR